MCQTTIFVHASVSRIYGIAKERKLRVGQVHENLCSYIIPGPYMQIKGSSTNTLFLPELR